MLRRQQHLRTRVQKLVDVGLFTLGFWLAHLVRSNWNFLFFWERPEIPPFEDYAWFLVVIVPVTPLLLELQGFYNRPLVASRRQTIWQLFWASTWATIIVILASFLAREQPARAVIILFGAISLFLVMLKEELVRRWVESNIGQEQFKRRLLLVGTEEDTRPLRKKLTESRREALEIIAEADLSNMTIEGLLLLIHEHSVNGVILSAKHIYFGQVEKVIQACELEGVEVWLLADFFKTEISQTTMDEFQGRPMLVFRSTPEASWQALSKQVVDIVGAAALLLFFSPFIVGAALMIRFTSPGPVFFRQQRSGLNGRPFTMLKFRSMVTNAEQRKHEIAMLNEMSGPVFKVTNDPRITPIGRFLRKFSIDEFPQLLNVLRGEMSLVGPRPLPVDEVKRFDDLAHRRRLSVKPGITCLWQVSGRNNVKDFRDWVRLDLEYIDNWTIWLDFKILLRTIPVVLLGTGAK
ncbi:MAG TPA: sugar transferase [Verrucomicrobiae bacterium]|nr:sugar transferase [Verrucomicrobiae bacterium]